MAVLCLYKEKDLIMIVSGIKKDIPGWFDKGMDRIHFFSIKKGKLIKKKKFPPKKP